MKIPAFLLLLAAPVLAPAMDVHLGDSLADVRSALGAPRGQAQLGDRLVLFYDRGQVQLVDGRVTNSDFLSPQDFATLQARRAADAAHAAQLRARHIAEGEALKAKKLADPAFTSAPPAYQLAFWQNFRRQYPEVSCDDEYALALARRQEQLEQEGHDQNMADLQTRVANAEDRAATAEREARQARYGGFLGWPVFFGDAGRHDRFRDRDHDHDRDRAPPPWCREGPTATTSAPGMTGRLAPPPSATGLRPPPSSSGLTSPPSAWPAHG